MTALPRKLWIQFLTEFDFSLPDEVSREVIRAPHYSIATRQLDSWDWPAPSAAEAAIA